MAAMNLHGDFAGPELKGYLLIEHARNHQAYELVLACGQRIVALSQLGKLMVSRLTTGSSVTDTPRSDLVPNA